MRRPAARRTGAQAYALQLVVLSLAFMLGLGLSTPAASMPLLAGTSAVQRAPAVAEAAPPGGTAGPVPLIPDVDRIGRPGRPERLVIPRLGIDTPVLPVEPVVSRGRVTWETAERAAAYHVDSVLPGEAGTAVFSGHLGTPLSGGGRVFATLPDARVGDTIEVYTDEASYRYEVRELRLVRPEDVDAIPATGEPLITLITCYPEWRFDQRLLVTAALVTN